MSSANLCVTPWLSLFHFSDSGFVTCCGSELNNNVLGGSPALSLVVCRQNCVDIFMQGSSMLCSRRALHKLLFSPVSNAFLTYVAAVRVREQAMEHTSEVRWDANMENKMLLAHAEKHSGPRVLSQMVPQTSTMGQLLNAEGKKMTHTDSCDPKWLHSKCFIVFTLLLMIFHLKCVCFSCLFSFMLHLFFHSLTLFLSRSNYSPGRANNPVRNNCSRVRLRDFKETQFASILRVGPYRRC